MRLKVFGIQVGVLTIRASDEPARKVSRDKHSAREAEARHLRLAHSRLLNLLARRVPIVRRLNERNHPSSLSLARDSE